MLCETSVFPFVRKVTTRNIVDVVLVAESDEYHEIIMAVFGRSAQSYHGMVIADQ